MPNKLLRSKKSSSVIKRQSLARSTSRISAKKTSKRVSRVKKKKAVKPSWDVQFIYKSAAAVLVLVAVIIGVQFVGKDNSPISKGVGNITGKVAGNTEGKSEIYLSSPNNAKVGDVLKFEIWVNSKEQYNAVQVAIAYTDQLEFVKLDDSTSAFDVDPPIKNDNGVLEVPKGTMTPLTGNQLVAIAEFKVVKAGSAIVELRKEAKTMLLSSEGHNNLLSEYPKYTIKINN